MYKIIKLNLNDQEQLRIQRTNSDSSYTSFSADPANTDYQAFLAWKAEGNEPLPADEQQELT